jgi:ferritin-like metal-binding protein YciE
VLPTLAREAADEELEQALREHLEQTREHVLNVERAFRRAQAEPAAARSKAFEGLVAEHESQSSSIVPTELRDGFHAAAALRTEHLELAAYDALLALARAAAPEAEDALAASRKQEDEARKKLEKIAERLLA